MFAIKPISQASIPGALAKAERYRLLNEPHEAESICRDILEVEPNHREATVSLILALTDQIPHEPSAFSHAVAAASSLDAPYDRAYHAGIAWERRAKAYLQSGGQGSHHYVYEWIIQAMRLFEEAEALRTPGNDDAILRWNACTRFLARHPELAPGAVEIAEPILSE